MSAFSVVTLSIKFPALTIRRVAVGTQIGQELPEPQCECGEGGLARVWFLVDMM